MIKQVAEVDIDLSPSDRIAEKPTARPAAHSTIPAAHV
jgi:hypothetical protein